MFADGCSHLAESNQTLPMDDLSARLEALLRLYSAACDQSQGDGVGLAEQFRKDLQLLVTEYGPKAVDEALDKIPDEVWPSVSLH